MSVVLAILFLISIFGIYYFIKKNPNKKYRNYSILATIILFFLVGSSSNSSSATHKKDHEKIKTVYVGKKNYVTNEKYKETLLAKKALLNRELHSIDKKEKAEKEKHNKEVATAEAKQHEIEMQKQAEAEQVAQEKEQHDEQAAQEKKQAEQQAQIAQENQKATQSQQQASAPQPAPNSRTVFIAPNHGKKYHYDSSCRGLRNAISISSMTEAQAQSQGYTLCGWE